MHNIYVTALMLGLTIGCTSQNQQPPREASPNEKLPGTGRSAQPSAHEATSAVLAGGMSPDGRYELRIVESPDREPSGYAYQLIEVSTRRSIARLAEGGGAHTYALASARSLVRWHASSAFFALTDQGTQRSQEMYVYEVRPTGVVLVPLPDYQQNALGRVNSTEPYRVSITEPQVWDGDLLKCRLTFDVLRRESSATPTYRVDFALRLWHGANSATRISLDSMGTPVAG